MSTSPNKTAGYAAPITFQDVPGNTVVVSSAVNVATKFAASAAIRLGRESGSAFVAGWPNIRIEALDGSNWIPIFTYQMQVGATLANTTLSAQANVGDSTIALSATTNIGVGDILFLGSNSGPTSYELCRVRAIVSSTAYLEENLAQLHENGVIVTDQAEMLFPAFDVTPYTQMRVVVDNATTNNVTFAAQVTLTTFDSIG